ncbi:hypothetical protein V865_006051 [Kwoniella europaea PYCC6329]|uniref:Uncharacterized protein n=1 Tax=Kwoniella europaea PYCC6329 TaxID=1423913 RepID=A0AAX4KRK3_9TREE
MAESHRPYREAESDDEDGFDYEGYQRSKLADSRKANTFGGPEIHSNYGSDLRRTFLRKADRRFSVTDHQFNSEGGSQVDRSPSTNPPSSEQSTTGLPGNHDNHSREVGHPPDYQFPTSSRPDGTSIAQGHHDTHSWQDVQVPSHASYLYPYPYATHTGLPQDWNRVPFSGHSRHPYLPPSVDTYQSIAPDSHDSRAVKEAVYRAKIEALRPDPRHVKAVENSYRYDYRKATGYDLRYATRERGQTEFDRVEEQFYRRYPEAADR